MQLITHLVHESLSGHDFSNSEPGAVPHLRILERDAARAIVRQEGKLLLMFTERYNDFSFPGGGIDPQECQITALKRELSEETGARRIQVLEPYGLVTEFMPTWKPEFDVMFQRSFWYHCAVASELGAAKLEDYEKRNGMRAMWVSPQEALVHNRAIIQQRPANMGVSIHRE